MEECKEDQDESTAPLNFMTKFPSSESEGRMTEDPYSHFLIEFQENKDIASKSVRALQITVAVDEVNPRKANSSRPPKKKCYRYFGLFLTILSSMMFSLVALIFKLLYNYHPLAIASWMFIGTGVLATIFNALYRLKGKSSLTTSSSKSKIFCFTWTTKQTFILLARGCSGCSGMLFFFYALQYLSIGDALVIACSSPVFVYLLAFIFLNESCGLIPVITITLTLLGVGIITRPPLLTGESFHTDDLIGAGLAFASMLSIVISMILMRYLQDVHHSLINLILGSWGSLQTIVMALIVGVLEFPQGISDGCWLIATGVLFFVGQTFLALALQLEESGPVSLLRTSEVVFAFIWQFLFLNVFPDSYSLTGAALIMTGILTTILRKWIAGLPTDHSTRKRFAFILR